MTYIPWEDLDSLQTADEIADLLRQQGIQGLQWTAIACPLAIATGWRVYTTFRTHGGTERNLTIAERDFIENFDHENKYPDLVISPKE